MSNAVTLHVDPIADADQEVIHFLNAHPLIHDWTSGFASLFLVIMEMTPYQLSTELQKYFIKNKRLKSPVFMVVPVDASSAQGFMPKIVWNKLISHQPVKPLAALENETLGDAIDDEIPF